ncbi:MAG: DMT family transporter [Alphaproteobacteria bacterium]|nr:DMT family transporter [Alphaproteobacteria bacterium]
MATLSTPVPARGAPPSGAAGRGAGTYVRGALYGLAAVSIWSGWIVIARLGLRTSLTPWDIAALRFGVAGVLMLPYVARHGLALAQLGWIGVAAIVLGGAAPVFFANAGLLFAPAAHAGALFPGVMPLMVALLAALTIGEPFTSAKRIGFALILPGVFAVAWGGGAAAPLGDALFLASGLAWACYTVAMRRARLDGLHAAALAAVGALVLYLPVYLVFAGATLIAAPLRDIVLQAVVQGVLTAIVSLMLYGRAVALLGASSGAAFASLCPAMTAVMAIPILDEWPAAIDWLGIAAISAGVYVVSGRPLPTRAVTS